MNQFSIILGRSLVSTACFFGVMHTALADQKPVAGVDAYIALQRDPLMMKYIHPARLKQGQEIEIDPSGALGVNAQFKRGTAKAGYIEEQRRATDFFLAPGLFLQNEAAIKQGLLSLNYGFSEEAADGSFPGNPDAFHSATFFMEGAAQGAILLQHLRSKESHQQLDLWRPRLTSLAVWLLLPENVLSPKVKADLDTFTHRYYSYAAALGMAGEFLDLPEATKAAEEEARKGIKAQRSDGVNAERGGFDAGYQTVGLQFATRYWFFCKDAGLRDDLAAMIQKGTSVLIQHLDAEWHMSAEGSTRIGKEKTREGITKTFNHSVLINVLVHSAYITGHREYRAVAENIGIYQVLPELSKAK